MKRNFLRILAFCVILGFYGCANKNLAQNQKESKATQILIISPLARINDSGFIHFGKNSTLVQIYSAGAGLFELKIAEKICINGACSAPEVFNEKFFGTEYYGGILADIIASKPLFGAKTTPNDCGGFSQKISDISYEVCENKTSFISKKAKIVFENQELSQEF